MPRHCREGGNPETLGSHFWVPASPGTTMVARRSDRPRQIRDGSCILSPGVRADRHFYSRSLGVHRGANYTCTPVQLPK